MAAFSAVPVSTGLSLSKIGSFASGLGSLAGGLGLGGKKKRGPSMQDMRVYNRQLFADKLKYAKKYGEQYGFHPLTALGMAPQGSMSFSSGTEETRDLAQMGQGIERALNAGRTGVQRKLDDLAIRKAEAEIDYIESQTSASQRAVAGAGATMAIRGNPDGTGNVELVPHRITSKHPNDSGRGAGNPPAFVRYDVGNGQTIELPYSDEGPSEAIQNLDFPFNYVKLSELYGKRNYPYAVKNARMWRKNRRFWTNAARSNRNFWKK